MMKELRSQVLKTLTKDKVVYCYGVSSASRKKTAKIFCGFNHARENGLCFVFGVNHELPQEVRTKIWLEEGLRLVSLLENSGFKIDRKMFGTDRDGRTFFVTYN